MSEEETTTHKFPTANIFKIEGRCVVLITRQAFYTLCKHPVV